MKTYLHITKGIASEDQTNRQASISISIVSHAASNAGVDVAQLNVISNIR
jgi:hypothetical protein